MVTGAKTKVLETTTFLTSTNYYDDRYRMIQSRRSLYDGASGGVETLAYLYDFPGKIKQTKQVQTFNSVTTTVDKFYTYDHAGRLTKTEQEITGDANGRVTVAENIYNEIGQLVDKKLHKTTSNNYLQSVDYTYNIRGWLTSINNPDNLPALQPGDPNIDLFGEKLLYETLETGLNTSALVQYNGNISAISWNSTQKSKQGYGFTYDGLNRLKESDHKNFTSAWTDNTNYEEKSLAYDKNGNINRLIRTNSSGGNMADYTYNYSGNKLSNINSGTAYAYDLNGNTTLDGLRGVSVAYNVLNLPKTVSKGTDNITYIYSAAGEKLAKKMTNNTYQYYAGNMVYKNDKSLNYLIFDEGLVNKTSAVYSYEYHLKDHLGNTRVTFQPNGSATTATQVAEYYPFGSSYLPVSPAGTNKYLYNAKEKQDDVLSLTPLDWYDYGARFYDAQLGRFHSQDRFAEKYLDFSPYQYAANNPVNFIDINGDSIRASIDALWAIYHALDKNSNVHFDVKNGMINPESFKDQASKSDDIVLKDLYEVAINKQTVEVTVGNSYDYKDINGNIKNSDNDEYRKFNTPYDYNTNEDPQSESLLKLSGEPIGKSFNGNTGRTLIPGNNSITGANSTNNNLQIIINGRGNLNHRAVGFAHELAHVVLYFNSGGKIFQHGQPGVNGAIDKRASVVLKRLGYDF